MPDSAYLHEPAKSLSKRTIDRHRALESIQEELQAVDWYDQRVEATSDPELAALLAHNRDEEKEHAAMLLEWLRRNDSGFDRHLRTYLFTTASITTLESGATSDGPRAKTASPDESLGIGSLKAVKA
ncbi:MAG: encapsulin-associated ferritin-like protein [Acidimicrobiia bacterium]